MRSDSFLRISRRIHKGHCSVVDPVVDHRTRGVIGNLDIPGGHVGVVLVNLVFRHQQRALAANPRLRGPGTRARRLDVAARDVE